MSPKTWCHVVNKTNNMAQFLGHPVDHLYDTFIIFRYSVTPAQIVLKWLISDGWSVLPKSSNPTHIAENIDMSFTINKKDKFKLSNLNTNM